MNDRMVWIDCEMTGLSLTDDALIEVAALVTDSELNVLGDGVDIVIRPPDAALETMPEVVRQMHTASGLLDELAGGTTLADAEEQVLAYIREHVKEPGKAPLCGNSVGTDRGFLLRDMPTLEELPPLPDRRCLLGQGAGPPLVPAGVLQQPGEERQPPGARRHPRVHRGAALLPRGGLRAAARTRLGHREGHRREARPALRTEAPGRSASPAAVVSAPPDAKPGREHPRRTLYTFSRPVGKNDRSWWV